ncbi:aminotransferase class IV [Streptomyces sp. NPDC101150]|uniref:aminotransferase class IV n=1 Tax=Streptomyces sp. NPDC101150 TaxID=3366114 RepID=UPI003816DE20
MALLNGHPADPDALRALALTNYGHFTTMRVDGRRVRGLSRHLERLVRDCRTVFGAELDPAAVRGYVSEAVGDRTGACVVRVTVLDPGLDIGRPAAADDPHVLVGVRPAAPLPLPPLRVATVRHQREVASVKHTGLFGSLYRRRGAQRAGFDDALFVGPDGLVSEGPTWNVGFVAADGGVVWPRADVLPGVTMGLLRDAHGHLVAPVAVGQLPSMRAAFATNTAIGVRAIGAVDEVRLDAAHPVLVTLRERYEAVRGERL